MDSVRAAAVRTCWTAGSSRPIRTAMMAMTTSSSISVKPRRTRSDERSMGRSPEERNRHDEDHRGPNREGAGKYAATGRRGTANRQGHVIPGSQNRTATAPRSRSFWFWEQHRNGVGDAAGDGRWGAEAMGGGTMGRERKRFYPWSTLSEFSWISQIVSLLLPLLRTPCQLFFRQVVTHCPAGTWVEHWWPGANTLRFARVGAGSGGPSLQVRLP